MIDLNKVLVTGAGGMVGSYVDFGIKTDRESLDITDLKKVFAMCDREKPSAILHLAAETDLNRCEENPERAYMINAVGTYNMSLAARNLGIKLVYISTSGIFDGKKQGPYVESDEGNPQNHYGHSKYLGELAVRGVLQDYIIARTSWIFGGGPAKDKKFVATVIKKLGDAEIKAASDSVGSPTYGKDIVAGIKKLLTDDARGVLNLANTGVCSRYDVALEIASAMRGNAKITPMESSFFKTAMPPVLNQGLVSREDLMRPWREALAEYLATEWATAKER